MIDTASHLRLLWPAALYRSGQLILAPRHERGNRLLHLAVGLFAWPHYITALFHNYANFLPERILALGGSDLGALNDVTGLIGKICVETVDAHHVQPASFFFVNRLPYPCIDH
jgi:hypothetical protein